MGVGPRTPITAPPNRAGTAGLIALGTNVQADGDRWVNGFAFDPETCADGLVYGAVCQTVTPKELPEGAELVTYDPVVIIGTDTCSTMSGTDRDIRGRANRHLLAVQSHHLEQVFWTGEATDDTGPEGGARPHLADGTATVLAGTATPLIHALAVLDQALTACLHGQAGMVHMTPVALAVYAGLGGDVVERVDGRWLTPNGHTVVAGSGYTGGGPRPDPEGELPAPPNLSAVPPANQWIYGTPQVQILLGGVEFFADVDRARNSQTTRAERPAAAFHGCCKFAIHVDLTI